MQPNTKVPFAPSEDIPRMARHCRTSGEFRPPLASEWYASGAIVEAYRAVSDFSEKSSFWICKPEFHDPDTDQKTLNLAQLLGDLQPSVARRTS